MAKADGVYRRVYDIQMADPDEKEVTA